MANKDATRYKIAYYTITDPNDKRSWSGITYHISRVLQEQLGDVDFLGPVKIPNWLNTIFLIIIKINRIFSGKEYLVKHSSILGIYTSKVLKSRMKNKQYDFIFAPAASTELAYLKTNIPIIFFSDATFNLIYKYYKKEYNNVSRFTILEGNNHERRALNKSKVVIHASKWASTDAQSFYGINKDKLYSFTMGANMEIYPDKNLIYDKLENKKLTLLFLAVDWERKGGDIVYGAFKKLLVKYPTANLIICGCSPPFKLNEVGVIHIPFINKNIDEDSRLFNKIMLESHFLVLPTRADCSLLVACESNAYGMPAISTATGGVSDVIINGLNGYCLDYDATSDDYANLIDTLFQNPEKYKQLIANSRNKFENDLNWNVWIKRFKKILEDNAIISTD